MAVSRKARKLATIMELMTIVSWTPSRYLPSVNTMALAVARPCSECVITAISEEVIDAT